jgi:hypothetical protein
MPKESYRMSGYGGRSSLTAGTNHPSGVQVHYYLPEVKDTDSIALRFKDNNSKLIKEFSTYSKEDKLKPKTGANSFSWDTEYDGAEKLDGMILWWASLTGPKATPGNYIAELEVNGEILQEAINIKITPNSEASKNDMQAQFDFVSEINETVDKAHKSIKNIRAFNKKLSAFKTVYGDRKDDGVKEMLALADSMKTKFGDVEKALYQTQNRSGQDPLNFPIKLTNKLAHLNALVTMGDFAPTEQDIAVKNELTAQIDAELEKFNTVLDSDIKEFNTKFNALKLDYLVIEKED